MGWLWGCAVWAVGLEAVGLRCDRRAGGLCAVLLPAGCGLLWPLEAVGLWPMAWRLCPWLVAVLVEAVSLCPGWGAIGGVYIKLPGDYTGRVKLPRRGGPSPRRPVFAVSMGAASEAGGGPPSLAAAPAVCRSPWRVGGPLCPVCAGLLSAGLLELPTATERATENAGENAPDFSGNSPGRLPPRSRSGTLHG